MKVLYSEQDIHRRVVELGRQIPRGPLHCVVVLTGAYVFAADLLRCLTNDVTVEFVTASSYGNDQVSKGEVQLTAQATPLNGRNILLIEDIVDTGRTLQTIVNTLWVRQARTIKTVCLLDKPSRRVVPDVVVDYVGFTIPDVFVVGYGMDDAGRYRNLPDIQVQE